MERQHPRLYDVLREYFRQDTAARFKHRPGTAGSSNAKAGSTLRTEKKEGATTMHCPKDGATLKTQTYEANIRVDVCPSCRGMWLDKGELEQIQATVERDHSEKLAAIPKRPHAAAQARQSEQPTLSCPRCGHPMQRKEHPSCSHVLIDVCARCEGIWLDEGEIEELEQAYERAQTEIEGFRQGLFAGLMHLFPLCGSGTIKAQFVRKADGKPISGASGQYCVKLYDKDLFRDDELGTPRLDADGRVQCTFDLYDIVSADSPLERRPDLYLVLYERDKEVFRTPVFWNLDFEKRDAATGKMTAVTHDLGTFAV
jgi:Zn-finger nucleic acid-binding protein